MPRALRGSMLSIALRGDFLEKIQADVAIVGAGGAGLRAAIALAQADPKLKIALVSKVYPMRSHTCAAEGGAAGVIKPDDSLEHHFNDTVGGGDWLSDQDAVDYFIREAPKELIQLEHWGCPWSREANGSVAVRPFGGMKKQRTWFAADKSGFHILHTLFQTSLQFETIQRYDEFYATELLVHDGRCAGFTAIEMRSGQMRRFDARAVIICGGGAGRIFPFTTNGAIKTGDGMALAYRAGVALKDMEFVQYHPTGLPSTGTLLTEACRGEGGVLVNKNGRRFLQDYGMGPETPLGKPVLKTMELGPRDRVSQAFWHEQRKGNAVSTQWGDAMLLDMRHLGEKKINERLPLVRDMSISYMSVDPVKDPVPVRPVVHYMMGGIHTDIRTATSLPGLFAAGECACVSINGANRLGSNSLTELLVFGRRAAMSAMEYLGSAAPAADRRQGNGGGPAQGDDANHGGACRHLSLGRGPGGGLRQARRSAPPLPDDRAARQDQCLQHRPATGPRIGLDAGLRRSRGAERAGAQGVARRAPAPRFRRARRQELPAPFACLLQCGRGAADRLQRSGDHPLAARRARLFRRA